MTLGFDRLWHSYFNYFLQINCIYESISICCCWINNTVKFHAHHMVYACIVGYLPGVIMPIYDYTLLMQCSLQLLNTLAVFLGNTYYTCSIPYECTLPLHNYSLRIHANLAIVLVNAYYFCKNPCKCPVLLQNILQILTTLAIFRVNTLYPCSIVCEYTPLL